MCSKSRRIRNQVVPGDGCKEGRKLGSRSVVLGNHAVVDNVVEDVEVGSGVVVVVDLKNSILLM